MTARVSAFNNLLHDTMSLVSKKFPNDKELDYTKSQIELSLSMSPFVTITTFVTNAMPYVDEINKRDETYFLSKANNRSILLNLSDKWRDLTDSEKDKIWSNIQKMLRLGRKIMTD